jgi:hypothetical protein
MRRPIAILVLMLPALALAGPSIELTQEEFKMYRHWQRAIKDPRVEKMAPEKRNPAIAKDARFKLKDMEVAVEKGEAAGDLGAQCATAIRGALTGPLGGALGTIEVDSGAPHAVAYVNWHNESLGKLEEEASLIAAHTAKACPILSTIQVTATDKANPRVRLFQALISQSAASRISIERARDFAHTRYIRLFESVKSIANGDTFDAAPETAAGGAAPSTGAL